MNRFAVFLAGVLACWAGFVVLGDRPQPARGETPKASPAPAGPGVEAHQAREQAADVQETEASIQELGSLARERDQQNAREATTYEARSRVQAMRSAAWTLVIEANWPTYQALREQARRATNNVVECAICCGSAAMDLCVVCQQSGKCIICDGAGKSGFGEPCPTCGGSGKCYLCLGSGRMPCPFCDDGHVSLDLPPPTRAMPGPKGMAPIAMAVRYPAETPGSQSAHRSVALPGTPDENAPSPPAKKASPSALTRDEIFRATLIILAGLMAVRKLAPGIAEFFNQRCNPWERERAPVMQARLTATEDKALAELLASFRYGLEALSQANPPGGRPAAPGVALDARRTGPKPASELQEFFASAGEDLATMRNHLSEIARVEQGGAAQKSLADLMGQMRSFKRQANLPELLPVWQMAVALEGLLAQLTQKAAKVAPSVLSTLASGIDLLAELCVAELRADLSTSPPVRLLVVDDDPLCRHAVAYALKRAMNPPDLAANGEAALALVTQIGYDAIFLDVQMPGIDGFELCKRIRATAINRSTPVAFVTCQNDFESRAKSTQTGAQDLIGKPFLTFEITVKALTMVFRRRLERGAEVPGCRSGERESVGAGVLSLESSSVSSS